MSHYFTAVTDKRYPVQYKNNGKDLHCNSLHIDESLIFDLAGTQVIGDVEFTGAVTLSGNPSSTHTTTWSGPWASPLNGDVEYIQSGKVVTLNIPTASNTATANLVITGTTALPAALRPAALKQYIVKVTDNSVNKVGTFTIGTNGVMNFYADAAGSTAFTNTGTAGFASFSVSYIVP